MAVRPKRTSTRSLSPGSSGRLEACQRRQRAALEPESRPVTQWWELDQDPVPMEVDGPLESNFHWDWKPLGGHLPEPEPASFISEMSEVWDSDLDSAMDIDEVGFLNLERVLAEFGSLRRDSACDEAAIDMEWEATHVDSPMLGREPEPEWGPEARNPDDWQKGATASYNEWDI